MTEVEKIEKMVVEITTGKARKSDTDNPVELYIGGHEWNLDIPNCDDFERGKTDKFELEIPDGMDSTWFRYFCLKKNTHTGKDDDWNIDKIKVIINDKVVYEKENINAWLKDNHTSWCAPGFSYGSAAD